MEWRRAVRLDGTGELELHHIYRAMGFLGDHAGDQRLRTKFSPRRNKDIIEESLFDLRRDLFTSVDLVFFDTTSIYFEGEGGGDTLGRRGHNKDHRPDLKQMVVGVVLDDKGIPICCEMWPGNTADVTTLKEVVKRFQTCFGIRDVCIVADRGMISAGVLQFLESGESTFSHILGVRMRNVKDVRIQVMSHAGRYHEVERDGGEKSPMKVKQVVLDGRRYVVCLNEAQARKDRADRAAIVESLRKKLREGDKSLVGNKGYRKYLKSGAGSGFVIDEDKLKEEERFDGKWVLTTDKDSMTAAEVAIQYKRLWMVENTFRTMKSGIDTRPIYHKCVETICGHVFCSFLAILLRRELERRMDRVGCAMEWKDVLRGLEAVEEVTAQISGKTVVFRSELREGVGKVFQAAGVAVPPTVRFA
jgi:transposase